MDAAASVPTGARGAARFTFRGNLRETRHGWLRLTPAYSVHLVRELVRDRARPDLPVLDPFCGTGTTLLACAELGVPCDSIDVNPFLVWLARTKVARYDATDLDLARAGVAAMRRAARSTRARPAWVPALHRIERWWDGPTLAALGRAFEALRELELGEDPRNLALLSFCRALIRTSNASFRHQSMSFRGGTTRDDAAGRALVSAELAAAFDTLAVGATARLGSGRRRALAGDARDVVRSVKRERYGTVITSPPYANRMSYVRELRPYMYWLGFLSDGRSAGELDWRAIGGTWGIATSNLGTWTARSGGPTPLRGFPALIRRIAERSPLLSRYVARYFEDMTAHLASLRQVVAAGGQVHYVVGNSKFYDVLLPVERILASQLEQAGFHEPRVEVLRKRTSKPELFEYLVSARG